MTLLLTILGTSLLGSVHCAAMCGGFVCLYSGSGPARHTGAAPHVAYNAGRLVSYLLLGAIAGSVGRCACRPAASRASGHRYPAPTIATSAPTTVAVTTAWASGR
jgi:sulfite exporter TauE/SafE